MARFFVPPDQIHGTTFILKGSEAHHALHVMRKKPGDELHLFDGMDRSFVGRIDAVADDQIRGTVLADQATSSAVLRGRVILYQALIKAAKWDWLVEKACEVGVAELVPLVTARTLVRSPKDVGPEKQERWGRIALEASKQCGRASVMTVRSPISLPEALEQKADETVMIIPWEKESKTRLEDSCRDAGKREVRLFIGPEGGWDDAEIEQAKHRGAIPVKLGPTLLRSETAGLVAATLALAALGDY